jgi:hypothetical protein
VETLCDDPEWLGHAVAREFDALAAHYQRYVNGGVEDFSIQDIYFQYRRILDDVCYPQRFVEFATGDLYISKLVSKKTIRVNKLLIIMKVYKPVIKVHGKSDGPRYANLFNLDWVDDDSFAMLTDTGVCLSG